MSTSVHDRGPARDDAGRFAPGDASREEQTARFWARVRKGDGCWLWQEPSHEFGYGQMRWLGTCRAAHVVSWEIHFGPVPHGLVVGHHCDTPACVRPDHLFLGTQVGNLLDMRRKEREARGEKHGNAILKEADVLAIRAAHAGGESIAAVGRRFGITYYHAWDICSGRSWRHATAPEAR